MIPCVMTPSLAVFACALLPPCRPGGSTGPTAIRSAVPAWTTLCHNSTHSPSCDDAFPCLCLVSTCIGGPSLAIFPCVLLPLLADLVLPYGYPLEEHFVTTQDGYILRMYRIPHGRDPLYRRDAGSKQAQQGEGGAATAAAAAAARAAEAAAAMAGAAVAGAAVAVGNVVEGAVGGVLSVASTAAKAASTRVVRAADDRAGEGQDTAGEGRDAAAAVDAAPAANDAAPEQVAEGAGSGGPGAATGLGADAAETQWQQQEQEQADGSSSVPGAGAGAGAGPHDVNARRGPPLLLQHGLLDSAAEFLVLGPEKALAFLLADAGELQHTHPRKREWCGSADGERRQGRACGGGGTGEGAWLACYTSPILGSVARSPAANTPIVCC